MSTPNERALAFLVAIFQERELADGKIPPNFNQFVADTTLQATAHFGTVEPDVKAKIIEDANSESGKTRLREHKKLMARLKTDTSAPKPKETVEPERKLTPQESRDAAQARFAKEKRHAKRSQIPSEVDVRWKDMKKCAPGAYK
jgi:hypothetical protein